LPKINVFNLQSEIEEPATQIFSPLAAKCQETKTDLDYQQVNWY